MKKHGHTAGKSKTPIYRVWCNMVQRCNDKNSPTYARYGARGIRIIWNNFEDFLRDMQESWAPGLSIERKDNNGPYCKDNCKWATVKEQALNRRSNVFLTHDGKTQTLSEWANELGIDRRTLRMRMKLGWSDDEVISTPLRGH